MERFVVSQSVSHNNEKPVMDGERRRFQPSKRDLYGVHLRDHRTFPHVVFFFSLVVVS